MRVAAGAVAKKVISHLIKPKIEIIGSVIQLGDPFDLGLCCFKRNLEDPVVAAFLSMAPNN